MKKVNVALMALLSLTLVACGGKKTSSSQTLSSQTLSSILASSSSNKVSSQVSFSTSSSSIASSTTTTSSSSLTSSNNLEGKGSEEEPYLIQTASDLLYLANYSKTHATSMLVNLDEAVHYEITNDIDLRGIEWESIGPDVDHVFTGYINGNGHVISNFKQTGKVTSNGAAYGLFGYANAYIYNLKVEDFTIDVTNTRGYDACYIGGLVGFSAISQYSYCHASGEISYQDSNKVGTIIGGLIGYDLAFNNIATSRNFCSSDVSIYSSELNTIAGGLIGYLSTNSGNATVSISSCYSKGDISVGYIAGGISGYLDNYTSIGKSYSSSAIELANREEAYGAGIAALAEFETAVTDCFYVGDEIYVPKEGNSDPILALYTEDDHEFGYLGTLSYRNSTLEDSSFLVNNKEVELNEDMINSYPESSFFEPSFMENELFVDTNAFDLHSDSYPTLKEYSKINTSKKVTISYEGKTKDCYAYYYNPIIDPGVKENYTFNGYFYDEYYEFKYRFYLPHYEDKNLYSRYMDNSKIEGIYIGSEERNGLVMMEKDGKMTWYHIDESYSQGRYNLYNGYLFFEIDSNEFTSGWDNTYASVGTSSFEFDSTDYSTYHYKFTKAASFAGYFSFDNNKERFYFDGRGKGTYYDGNSMYSFTYAANNSKINLNGNFNGKTIEISYNKDEKINYTLDVKITMDGEVTNRTFTRSNGLIDYTDKPYINKTYYTIFMNGEVNGEDSRDLTFKANGTLEARKRYLRDYYLNSETEAKIKLTNDDDSTLSFIISDFYNYQIRKENGNYYLYSDYNEYEEAFAILEKKDGDSNSLYGKYTGKNIYFSGEYYYDIEINEDMSKSYFIQWCEYTGSCTYNVTEGNIFTINSASYMMRGTIYYDYDNDIFYGTPTNGDYTVWANEKFVGMFLVGKYTIWAYENSAYYYDTSDKTPKPLTYEGSFANGETVSFTLGTSTKSYKVTSDYLTYTLTEI